MYQIWEFLKYTVVALFGVIYIMFTSCTGMPEPFHQDTADISMIELIDHTDSSQSLIHTVSSQKYIEGFMTDLCKLRCFKRFEPETSISDYGIYEIRIYYTDFAEYDVFIIGSRSDGIIQNGEEHNYGTYWYKEEDLEKLFEKYAYSADRHFVREQQMLTLPSDLGKEWVCMDPPISLTYVSEGNDMLDPKAVLSWNDQTIDISLFFAESGSFGAYPRKYDERFGEWLAYHYDDRLFTGSWEYRDGDLVVSIEEDFIFDGAYTELVFSRANEEIP